MKLKTFALLLSIILFLDLSIAAYILNNPPTTVLVTPPNTFLVHENLVRFSWNFYDIDNDTQQAYWIAIADNPTFVIPIINKLKKSLDKEVLLNLNEDKTYYWAVKTYDGKDWSEWSDVQTFTIYTSQTKTQIVIENKCQDGTLYNKCSIDLKYCFNGNLVEDCSKCGCPSNKVCQENGICKELIQQPIEIQKKGIFRKIIDFIKLLFTT